MWKTKIAAMNLKRIADSIGTLDAHMGKVS